MRSELLRRLISRFRGDAEVDTYFGYDLDCPRVLEDSAQEILELVPPRFGHCALLSASWAGYLRSRYAMPAVVIAGDLQIQGSKIFECGQNLPEPTKAGRLVVREWDGHCWIEIGGSVGDLSIFRTAYAIDRPSVLKEFVVSSFGLGRGALISPIEALPAKMRYTPKFVLTDNQIEGLIAGMHHQLERGAR